MINIDKPWSQLSNLPDPNGNPSSLRKISKVFFVYTSVLHDVIQGSVASGKQERRMRFTDMGSKERLKLLRPMFPAKARLKKTSVPLSSQVLLMAGDSNRLMCFLCTGGEYLQTARANEDTTVALNGKLVKDHDGPLTTQGQCGAKPNNFVRNWTMRLSLFTA